MATLYITEYEETAKGIDGSLIGFMREPAIASQSVSFTTAAQSSAFNAKTRYVKLNASAACRVLFGTNPTAVAGSEYIPATTDVYRRVDPGLKVSVYDGSS